MTQPQDRLLDEILATRPLVAILRGITPDEVEPVVDALVTAGFRLIEIPLNSPDPWTSIERAVARCPTGVLVGAGTVLDPRDAERLAERRTPLLVTPNTDPEVIAVGLAHDLMPLIGCMTPTEALAAVRAGARGLKLFPAARLGPGYYRDIRAILPPRVPVLAVGGIERANMAEWLAAGIDGFGFGGNLYRPDRSAEDVGRIAGELVAEWHRLQGEGVA
ncbi:2-dehydro-3-deoxy-6-phosphogalactonate aldolase [Halomonas cerina]|uniref:2-dehydro-3-deoxyphosphogalactonate aldolase n=1 Tax=Halomonas cerina TaxID=447424 RepID=A0A839V3X0_9GAMM|nr:2-dehydro-3-deoxy-6-phosphogalactonate aldolase [Halomonas cerina]MBB3189851.1 2-dehydro-3-deoxyphosphogalactonate aldolase [Halomonas cerina]